MYVLRVGGIRCLASSVVSMAEYKYTKRMLEGVFQKGVWCSEVWGVLSRNATSKQARIVCVRGSQSRTGERVLRGENHLPMYTLYK